MHYARPPLVLAEKSLQDALGTIHLRDLPAPQPTHPYRLQGTTPLIERLWRIALSDVEANTVETDNGCYFGAGTHFGLRIYTRDISYAGLLGLNAIYPKLMRQSLNVTRHVRLRMGLTVARGYAVPGITADWEELDVAESSYLQTYHTNSYTRRTDDVIWLWCARDLFEQDGTLEDWRWLYETGRRCFDELYTPFFDPEDGLYRGQASFIDIHFADHKTTGYPLEWTLSDCVMAKALSTNCLYVQGLRTMATAAKELDHPEDARRWSAAASDLVSAIRRELAREDGALAYLKDRWGHLAPRRGALGIALAVLSGVVTGEEAAAAVQGYPVTDAGVPLLHPFYNRDDFYHNNSSWPFVDTFFLKGLETIDGVSRTAQNAALLARTCRGDGTFHEVVDFRDKTIQGSGSQLWSAAAFIDVCRRADLISL